jgi:hypothetical protein
MPSPDGGTGEDPDRMPLTVEDFEQVAREGGLEPGRRFARQAEAHRHAQEGRSGPFSAPLTAVNSIPCP